MDRTIQDNYRVCSFEMQIVEGLVVLAPLVKKLHFNLFAIRRQLDLRSLLVLISVLEHFLLNLTPLLGLLGFGFVQNRINRVLARLVLFCVNF
jgi:hypothetical protein